MNFFDGFENSALAIRQARSRRAQDFARKFFSSIQTGLKKYNATVFSKKYFAVHSAHYSCEDSILTLYTKYKGDNFKIKIRKYIHKDGLLFLTPMPTNRLKDLLSYVLLKIPCCANWQDFTFEYPADI